MLLTSIFSISILNSLISQYSYFGAFLVGLITSSTIFLPLPGTVMISLMAGIEGLNPILLGIFAGLGSTIGELTSYLIGRGVSVKDVEKLKGWKRKFFESVFKYFDKYGFFTVIIFAFQFIVPFDFIGIFAGFSKMKVSHFFLATLIGKILKFYFFAYFGLALFNLIPWI
jgi:membrane protein YqaA with SNARE-associated domain